MVGLLVTIPLMKVGSATKFAIQDLLNTTGPSAAPGDAWPAYFNADRKEWVQASHPVMPPHYQTGALRNSIKYRVFKTSHVVNIYCLHKFGAVLEYGWGRMKGKRPFMRTGLYEVYPNILGYFKGFLRSAGGSFMGTGGETD